MEMKWQKKREPLILKNAQNGQIMDVMDSRLAASGRHREVTLIPGSS